MMRLEASVKARMEQAEEEKRKQAEIKEKQKRIETQKKVIINNKLALDL